MKTSQWILAMVVVCPLFGRQLATMAVVSGAHRAGAGMNAGVVGRALDQQEYNVLDYGATGDGVTDDSAAIQAALNDADAAGGAMVWFPQGTYVAEGLILGSNVSLLGDGLATIQMKAGSTVNLLSARTQSDIWIGNLIFDLNGMNQAAPDDTDIEVGVYLRDCSRTWIGNCRFTGCCEVYVMLHLSDHCQVEDCLFEGQMPAPGGARWYSDDIQVQGCDYVTIRGNQMLHPAPSHPSYGIGAVWTSNCEHVTIEDNTAWHCGRESGSGHQVGAIDLYDNSHDYLIQGNQLEQCQAWAVRLKCLSPSDNIRILNNDLSVSDGLTREPIWIVRTHAPVSYIWIENNRIEAPEDIAVTQVAGIRVQEAGAAGDEPNNIWICGNDIPKGEYGIFLQGVRQAMVTGNRTSVQSYGIVLGGGSAEDCNFVSVVGNDIDASRNTRYHAMVVSGGDILCEKNRIRSAYNGIITALLDSGEIRSNVIEARRFHILLYSTTGATSPVLLEKNTFIGSGSAYYKQGGETVVYR